MKPIKKLISSVRSSIKKHPLISIAVLIIVIVIAGFKLFAGNGKAPETITVHRSDYTNVISVAGKVVAARAAELGFDQSGRIAAVYQTVGAQVTMGTAIASIENGSIRADIAQKQAHLEQEQAKLAAAERGTRKEQVAVYEQSYTDASSALVIAMRDAYLQTEGAILNKADSVFDNGTTVNPTINIRTQSYNEKLAIEQERSALSEKLQSWKSALGALTFSSDAATIRSTRALGSATMSAAKVFLDHLATITNNLTVGNAGMSQTVIDTYRSNINSAGQSASAAASSEQAAYTSWSSATASLTLQRSGSTSEDLTAQNAAVKAAAADLANAQAQLAKTIIAAPFDGIVTKMDAKIGEIASPNTSLISVMSSGAFEIESYIPEIHIPHIKIGDPAAITLDAYGSDASFTATVISIDPAETVKDGVPTYKTRLRFAAEDARIKSGMTANIRITTEQKTDIILIPKKIITDRNGKKFVSVRNAGQDGDTGADANATHEVEIQVGDSTTLGQIEVISGLSEGDVIVVPASTP